MSWEDGGSLIHLCDKYLLWAYYMPDVVEGQSFSHSFFPQNVFLEHLHVAGGNGDLVLHFFPRFLLNAFSIQIFIECFPKVRGDKHLPFICSFIQYIIIKHTLSANGR